MDAGRKMLNENKVEEPQELEAKLNDLRSRFEVVLAMSATKQDRLDNALVLATEFDIAVKTELQLLKEFEDNLRDMGPIGDDLDSIKSQLEQHRVCWFCWSLYKYFCCVKEIGQAGKKEESYEK